MNYNSFKALWTRALSEAGLLSSHDQPEESIELGHMARLYSICLGLCGPQMAEPFTTTCQLEWRWDALQTARTATTEEDMLTELHGRSGAARMDTERPWLRLDIELRALLPWDQARAMPSPSMWRRWVAEVTERVMPLFPVEEFNFCDGSAVLGWCGQPVASVQCEADGKTMLTGVKLEAWQPILLERRWDDPERTPDPGSGEQLGALGGRLGEAVRTWTEAARVLTITVK